MPHLIVEYSANIEDKIALDGLLDKLHASAVESGMFPLGGIRIRAYRADNYRIADCDPDNGYVHVTAIVGHGRPLDQRERVSRTLFDMISTHLEPLFENSPLAISFNMREFDPVLNLKKNNLHEYAKARRGSGGADGG